MYTSASREVPSTAPPPYSPRPNAAPSDTQRGASRDDPQHLATERSPLVKPSADSPSPKTYTSRRFLVCIALLVLVVLAHWRPGDDALNPAVRARLRREWDVEVRAHEALRAGWETERLELVAMRDQLLRDRETWANECEANRLEEERRKQEDEERVRAGFAWEGLRGEERCLRHAAREYTARITNVPREYDPVRACTETAVEIHGLRTDGPQWCEDRGCGVVLGHWTVDYSEPTCVTYFDWFKDKGCTSPGSGRRRIESPLENLQYDDDWRTMCSTTPADFRYLHFDSPDMCENWGQYGVWGIWEIEDRGC
ncbi:hypothetical protein DFH07DRAFT_483446 [Mycena maculata]|uniref:Uncharacterized protein n=1 Tax=Mycena maculata TaxID=230809 RepID=A0AAD7J4G0_9AGAR|nr:hypothetical protein DFH07DRAFT_483446 [Mycena maculata]